MTGHEMSHREFISALAEQAEFGERALWRARKAELVSLSKRFAAIAESPQLGPVQLNDWTDYARLQLTQINQVLSALDENDIFAAVRAAEAYGVTTRESELIFTLDHQRKVAENLCEAAVRKIKLADHMYDCRRAAVVSKKNAKAARAMVARRLAREAWMEMPDTSALRIRAEVRRRWVDDEEARHRWPGKKAPADRTVRRYLTNEWA